MLILVPFKPIAIAFGFLAALMLFCYLEPRWLKERTPSPHTGTLRTASLLGSRRRTLRRNTNAFTNPTRPNPTRTAVPAHLFFWRVAYWSLPRDGGRVLRSPFGEGANQVQHGGA